MTKPAFLVALNDRPAGRARAWAAWAPPWWLRVLLAWAVLAAMLLIVDAPRITAGQFSDPDDALRLVQVRDLLGGQGWFDLHQYRIAAPAGVLMHWSRLVDMPLAAMIVILRPLLGQALAETLAIVAVPLLTLLATLMMVGRLAARFFDGDTVTLTCLVAAIGTPLLFQMTPMRIDHHGWQIVLALVALNGLAARDPLRGGLTIGLAMAASLAISIEGLPLTAVFLSVLALRGLIDLVHGQHTKRLSYSGLPMTLRGRTAQPFAEMAAACAALAFASAGIFVGTRSLGDLATHCDQISPVHLAMFAVVAAGTGSLVWLAPRRWATAVIVLGVTGAASVALYLGIAPQCRGGAFVALDPLVMKFWYNSVNEGLPVWHLPLLAATESIGVPLMGLASIAILWRTATQSDMRAWWRDHALVLIGAILVAVMLSRASATACGIAAMPTGAVVARWIVHLRTARPVRRIAGYLGVLVILMPPLPVLAVQRIAALRHAGHGVVADPIQSAPLSPCDYRLAAKALNAMPATDLFLPLDIGPDILVRTHQRVVATGHHRGAAAMHDVISAFMGTPDQAHAIVLRRHATWIAVCPDSAEPGNYVHDAPGGLMADLLRGRAPGWLQPVDLAPGSHIRFWRVKG